jgi:hypothetical protein
VFGGRLDRADYLIHWSRRHRFIYAEIPKAASSTILLTLQRIETGDRAWRPAELHRRATSPLLSPLSAPDEFLGALVSPDYFRFSFVRDPYTRTLSAYLDKLARPEPERAMRLKALGLRRDSQPSFAEFLEILTARDPASYDVHWARQSDLAAPDVIAYDIVGHFDSFDADIAAVLDRLGHDKSWRGDARRHQTGADTQAEALIGLRERRLIESIYAADFNRFGFRRSAAEAPARLDVRPQAAAS